MKAAFSHTFFIPLSEQKFRMYRYGNIWYMNTCSDQFRSI